MLVVKLFEIAGEVEYMLTWCENNWTSGTSLQTTMDSSDT